MSQEFQFLAVAAKGARFKLNLINVSNRRKQFCYFIEGSSMTHSLLQDKNDSEHKATLQTDSLRDSSVNHALIAIAQEVAELLRQNYPIQTDVKQEKQNDAAR
jgi:hypothetical protein